MTTLEEKYSARTKIIRKRYRFFVSSFLFAFVVFLPVSAFLDKIFPPNLIVPLIILYFGIFLIPGIVFAASRCPKCQKPLLALDGQVLRNIANFPTCCLHCGFNFFGKPRQLP